MFGTHSVLCTKDGKAYGLGSNGTKALFGLLPAKKIMKKKQE